MLNPATIESLNNTGTKWALVMTRAQLGSGQEGKGTGAGWKFGHVGETLALRFFPIACSGGLRCGAKLGAFLREIGQNWRLVCCHQTPSAITNTENNGHVGAARFRAHGVQRRVL